MNSKSSANQQPIKFLADAMLGRLAKWLRLLGYDTAFLADTDDFAVMRLARAEGRVILTRDHELAARRGIEALFVHSETLEEQLQQVWQQVGPPHAQHEPAAPRCPVCNTPLSPADAQTIAAHVPQYVQQNQEHFSFCAQCERVYWPGTHWEQMQALLDGITQHINCVPKSFCNLSDI